MGRRDEPRVDGPSPVVPPVPAGPKGGARKRSAAPWVLLGVVAGGAALLGITLFLLMPKRKTATDGVEPPGAAGEETESRPVVLTGSLSNGGWTVLFHLLETPSNIEYKHPGDDDWVSLGANQQDLESGDEPAARADVDDDRGPARARAVRGALQDQERRAQGAFQRDLRHGQGERREHQEHLRHDPLGVLPPGVKGAEVLFHASSASSALSRQSATGSTRRSRTRRCGSCLRIRMGGSREDQEFVDVPEGVSSVTVELTYLDGTKEKKRFKAKADR